MTGETRTTRAGTRTTTAPSVGPPGGGGGGGGGSADAVGGGAGATPAFASGAAVRRPAASVGAVAVARLASASSSAGADAFYRGGDRLQQQQQQQKQQQRDRIPRPDEPNLFDIPVDLHATYRPMPLLLQAGLVVASVLLVRRRDLSLSLFRQLYIKVSTSVLRRAGSFLLRILLVSTLARLAVQEACFPPSRVTTRSLAERGELPSRLSRYRTVVPLAPSAPVALRSKGAAGGRGALRTTTTAWGEGAEGGAAPTPLGVHSLHYTKRQTAAAEGERPARKYDGISLHHGFGASSLSWLPALPSLVERLGRGAGGGGRPAVGVAHDAPGFGFTDRPAAADAAGLEPYRAENNAGIGRALLQAALSSAGGGPGAAQGDGAEGGKETAAGEGDADVAIFGHSMGSRAALLMALRCAERPAQCSAAVRLRPRLVVLVAPALVGVSLGAPKGSSARSSAKTRGSHKQRSAIRTAASRVVTAGRKIFVDRPFRYGLRRLVGGTNDFWRKGLAVAWRDPDRLSRSDVLRYQWPSIGRGWETGLLNFARAQLAPASPDAPDDGQLLREVSQLKDTTVVIVYGSEDKVVRIEGPVAARLREEYPEVRLARVHGGHNPFEEDVEGFLSELEKVLDTL